MTVWMLFVVCLMDNPKQVQLEDFGLRFSIPPTWEYRTEGIKPMLAMARKPPREALLMLSRSDKDSSEAAAEFLASMEKSFQTHKLLTDGAETWGSVKGRLIQLEGTRGTLQLRQTAFVFEDFGQTFLITISTPVDKYPNLKKDIESIGASLTYRGKVGYAKTKAFLDEVSKPNPNYETLGKLLKEGADPYTRKNGRSTMMMAAITRDAQLFAWLLKNGVDPNHKENDPTLLNVVLTPPMKKLMKQHHKGEALPDQPKDLVDGIIWASVEKQLLAGIMNDHPPYVRRALENGADTNTKEPNYELAALPLTRKLIQEFRALDLDPGTLPEIEKMLLKAGAK